MSEVDELVEAIDKLMRHCPLCGSPTFHDEGLCEPCRPRPTVADEMDFQFHVIECEMLGEPPLTWSTWWRRQIQRKRASLGIAFTIQTPKFEDGPAVRALTEKPPP